MIDRIWVPSHEAKYYVQDAEPLADFTGNLTSDIEFLKSPKEKSAQPINFMIPDLGPQTQVPGHQFTVTGPLQFMTFHDDILELQQFESFRNPVYYENNFTQ